MSPNPNKMRISVIICAYTEERWDKLVEAIQSVQCQTVPAAEIVVVIDHNPHLFERIQQQVSGVRVVENQEAQGLSGARNTGLAAATGDVVAFLDDDAVAEPDWLALLTGHMDGPDILGVGGAVEPLWENGKPAWFPEEFNWVVGCTYLGLPEKTAPVRNPMGGCMCWRGDIFAVAGKFYNGLGHIGKLPTGCEETELCIRARSHWPQGYFLYEPKAKIHHHVPAQRARFAYFRTRCYSEGISKALVVKLVGSQAGLSSERSYTTKTLPVGVWRGIKDALHGDLNGLGRAGAIVLGLGFTTLGYVFGTVYRLTERRMPHKATAQEVSYNLSVGTVQFIKINIGKWYGGSIRDRRDEH